MEIGGWGWRGGFDREQCMMWYWCCLVYSRYEVCYASLYMRCCFVAVAMLIIKKAKNRPDLIPLNVVVMYSGGIVYIAC